MKIEEFSNQYQFSASLQIKGSYLKWDKAIMKNAFCKTAWNILTPTIGHNIRFIQIKKKWRRKLVCWDQKKRGLFHLDGIYYIPESKTAPEYLRVKSPKDTQNSIRLWIRVQLLWGNSLRTKVSIGTTVLW